MRRQQRRKRRSFRLPSHWLFAIGSAIALGSAGLNLGHWFQASAASRKELCQTVKQSSVVLSREQLAQLLTVAERADRKDVREIVNEPYCTMSALEVRAGIEAEREAYPLAFDPSTWLVVLYEGDEYAGYGFSFQ